MRRTHRGKESPVNPSLRNVIVIAPVLAAGLLAGALMAQDVQLPLAAIQVKPFTQVEGLGKSQDFLNYFYDGLVMELPKTKVAAKVVGEEAAVPEADAANAVLVEGQLTEVKSTVIKAEISLYRVSDHKLVKTFPSEVMSKPSPLNNDKNVGTTAGRRFAYEIQKTLKKLKTS
jgi:hypothetical protein